MPVRVAIHSSLVSTRASRSVLLRTAWGTLLPLPVILQPTSSRGPAVHTTLAADLRHLDGLARCRWWRKGSVLKLVVTSQVSLRPGHPGGALSAALCMTFPSQLADLTQW